MPPALRCALPEFRPALTAWLPALLLTTAWFPAAAVTAGQQSPSGGKPAALTLAEAGRARLKIVTAAEPAETVRQAAAELAQYLGQISGATFEVTTGDGSAGIVLGTLAEFPDAALTAPLKANSTFDGPEAYVIRTEPEAGKSGRLRLIGATEKGVPHAVAHVLRELGCRWYFPAPEWEVIPHRATLAVSLNANERPAIPARRIWWGYGFFDAAEGRCRNDYLAWNRRNRMGQSRSIWCGHAWQSIIAENRSTFDEHPEYLALVGGKRKGPQFCVSQPAVRKLATEWALAKLRRQPQLDMVSMETSDGAGHCECEECRRLGTVSDRAFGLASEVARAVEREFPGKMVGMYAYNDHCEPPAAELEPNVYVQSTAGFIRGQYTFDELMQLWPKKTKNIGFYEYYSVWLWDWDMPPGGRGANVKAIQQRIRQYAELGATSIDCESGNNWGLHGRGYYVASQLMWNPDASVDDLLADFYQGAFGPAAAVMQRYWERLDPGNEPLLSEHLLALALRELEEASRLAADHPDVLARLNQLKQYQHYVRLRWELDLIRRKKDEASLARRKELTLAALTHVYRTRYSYMNHWAAMWQNWTRAAAREFEEPEWAFNHKTGKQPWKIDRPLTAAETEELFQADLERFQPADIAELSFSGDLVPSGFDANRAAASRQAYQKGTHYAVYSPKGEPVELTVTTGVIAWYRDRAAARWTLADTSGKEITTGKLPQDGEQHLLKIDVPAAGLYHFTFNDQAAGWKIEAPAGAPLSLLLNRATHPLHMGHMQRMHFYVPRGTRELQYYWKGGPHVVHLPDGTKLPEVTTSGSFVTLKVPEGTDGQVWSFSRLALGHLWFFNAPNVLAASPAALLLPRDLLEADGHLEGRTGD